MPTGGLTNPPRLLYNVEVTWKGGRVVEGSGLENQRSESFRGFESHPFRLVVVMQIA